MASACLSVWEKVSPSSHLDADTSFPPHIPLVPMKLLTWCWSSEGVSPTISMCSFFKRNCLGIQQFLPLTQCPLVFIARSYGDLSSWQRKLVLGSWYGPGTPHSQDIPPEFLSTTYGCVTSLFCISASLPFLPPGLMWFL